MTEHIRHQCPVQTSAVYLIGRPAQPIERPPSPQSPPSPGAALRCGVASPLDELPNLSLDDIPDMPLPIPSQATAITTQLLSPEPCAPPVDLDKLGPGDHTVTAPPSPSSRPADEDHHSWSPSPSVASEPSPVAVTDRLAGAVHVLNAEAAAVSSLANLYATSPDARTAFDSAVSVIARNQARPPSGGHHGGGTLVMIGVGKSGHISRKLAATFSSLSLRSAYMHPTEALHGDLGLLHPDRDAVVLVSFSGKTPELLGLVPHLHPRLPVVIITAAPSASCVIAMALRKSREGAIGDDETQPLSSHETRNHRAAGEIVVLPAPIPISEVASIGVSAPTASTTAALALGDALAVVAAKEIHGSAAQMAAVFSRNHPGGAIGASATSGVIR